MSAGISFIVDIGMLVLLASTVYLAFRLNLNLKRFKQSRFEMEGLVNRLTGNIDKAERAIQGMQNAARNTGKELDEIISDAKVLADELKFMNQTGNNLADRLEKLAERNSVLTDKIEAAGTLTQTSSPSKPQAIRLDEGVRGFAIHDREFDEEFAEEEDEFEDLADDDFGGGGLQSQAERELFEALQKGKPRRMA
jgi:chromosome segregation ATPase